MSAIRLVPYGRKFVTTIWKSVLFVFFSRCYKAKFIPENEVSFKIAKIKTFNVSLRRKNRGFEEISYQHFF